MVLTYFVAACMVLCFGFVAKPVLVADQCLAGRGQRDTLYFIMSCSVVKTGLDGEERMF